MNERIKIFKNVGVCRVNFFTSKFNINIFDIIKNPNDIAYENKYQRGYSLWE